MAPVMSTGTIMSLAQMVRSTCASGVITPPQAGFAL